MLAFKLDRTAFKAQNALEASDHAAYYLNTTWYDRLKIAAYLNSVAFNYSLNNPPKLDRSKIKASSSISNG